MIPSPNSRRQWPMCREAMFTWAGAFRHSVSSSWKIHSLFSTAHLRCHLFQVGFPSLPTLNTHSTLWVSSVASLTLILEFCVACGLSPLGCVHPENRTRVLSHTVSQISAPRGLSTLFVELSQIASIFVFLFSIFPSYWNLGFGHH